MKKWIAVLLTLVLAFSLFACAKEPGAENTDPAVENTDNAVQAENEADDGGMVGIANPIREFADMAELTADVGFEMSVPESIEGYPTKVYDSINSSLAEVLYYSDNNDLVCIRKQPGVSGDISGVYDSFSQENTQEVNGATVTLKGDNDFIKVAIWAKDDVSFAVFASAGLTQEAMLAVCGEVA